MKDKLFFLNDTVTPQIITFIYWMLLIGVLGYGLTIAFGGYSGFTFSKFIVGLISIVFNAIIIRVLCELTIVFFNIYEELKAINKKLP